MYKGDNHFMIACTALGGGKMLKIDKRKTVHRGKLYGDIVHGEEIFFNKGLSYP